MEHKQGAGSAAGPGDAVRSTRLRPWQRALALFLAALIGSSPVAARGPGRAGIDALVEDPDPDPILTVPANLAPAFDPTRALPGNPTVPGLTVDAKGDQPFTVSVDAILGAPTGMVLGKPMVSDSGEWTVQLQGVAANATVNGQPATPAVKVAIGTVDLVPPLVSLKSVPVPPSEGIDTFVRDKNKAIALGKALFWDARAGSDGQACASCHFAAGADSRLRNGFNPGQRGGDNAFNKTFTGGTGPNYTLKPEDFPTHRLQNAFDRNSVVTFDSNDVVGSPGTFSGPFGSLTPTGDEVCANRPIDEFSVHGALTRRVEPRNTPTVINAAYNYRNFWDGRANNSFNGVNPFGDRDPGAKVLQLQRDGTAAWVAIHLPNASLASQAVGPALSDFEMSCGNKTFLQLGRKMVPMRALAGQKVHASDSVLGTLRDPSGSGLAGSYADMIKSAFQPQWWNAAGSYAGFTQMETNFSLYWGLAIMLYESTLVSDEAPIDKFIGWSGSPPNPGALSAPEIRGLAIFRGSKANCASCHRGAEFTSAASSLQPTRGETNLLEQMFTGGGRLGLYDSGFYNIGVRPAAEDVGVGGSDPFGNPLSFSREWVGRLRGKPTPDTFTVDACLFSILSDGRQCRTTPDPAKATVAVDGAMKTPSLRNVALTQPYFHNGSRYTLEQVVEFYNRGGDRRGPEGNDTTGLPAGTAPDGGLSNVHPAIHPIGLTDAEKADLVAFLRGALTDRRVACHKAPFDHPGLRITNGHLGDSNLMLTRKGDTKGIDVMVDLPAVGAAGLAAGSCMVSDAGTSFEPAGTPLVVQIPQGVNQLPHGETSLLATLVDWASAFVWPAEIPLPAGFTPPSLLPPGLAKKAGALPPGLAKNAPDLPPGLTSTVTIQLPGGVLP